MAANSGNLAAIVGVGAIMPEAPNAGAFWRNIVGGRYCITDVPKERWDPDLYYDPDPGAPDKTYSRIGGWVRDFEWNPLGWRMPIPPKVSEQIDDGQKWSVAGTREALLDAGWPERTGDPERTAVIIGNALAGEKHYETAMRVMYPEVVQSLKSSAAFRDLPEDMRRRIIDETEREFKSLTPPINEDTMPGELANIIAGRVCNVFNFRGPNFTADAACASTMAAMRSAIEGLSAGRFDLAITGGVDRNMGIYAFVKFCKIGALSATGTRPYGEGADGFVMGEGAALFAMKRVEDAERDGDRIYAIVRSVSGSSDGKGKGIAAPNPVGQKLAVERAWRRAGLDPATCSMVEGHGTSTRVGDVAEVQALIDGFGDPTIPPQSIALGSVKSNIGHLKAAAGAAGIFKATMALHEKVLPPTLNAERRNPNFDWDKAPFRINTELRSWERPKNGLRRAGVSAFGFGGTNFHAVLEEYVPGTYGDGAVVEAVGRIPWQEENEGGEESLPPRPAGTVASARPSASAVTPNAPTSSSPSGDQRKAPLRGLVVLGGDSNDDIAGQLQQVITDAKAGRTPDVAPPDQALGDAAVRLAIDFGDADELVAKGERVQKALATDAAPVWKMLRSQGAFLGHGKAPKSAFLYTGQGSQYVNMLKDLRKREPIVANAFAEADRVMTPLLGKPLSDYIFIDADDKEAVQKLEMQLLQTEITQPAVLATDLALTQMLAAYGITTDMVMGHSLGEYGALVAAGALSFDAALEAVSARGKEMADLALDDNGAMAAVFAPLTEIERIVSTAPGYAVIANVNSNNQAVVGGATPAVEQIVATFQKEGYTAVRIPVSHAFHTSIVAPVAERLKNSLRRLDITSPRKPIVANVNGEFYPEDADVEQMLEILGQQVASPVQFVKGMHTLYDAGARVFVEVGPKRALHGFVEDVLGSLHDDVSSLYTNHPKTGGIVSFNQALAGLYAAGYGFNQPEPNGRASTTSVPEVTVPAPQPSAAPAAPATQAPPRAAASAPSSTGSAMSNDRYSELGRLVADFLDSSRQVLEGRSSSQSFPAPPSDDPVVISGAGVGLPGTDRVFDDVNLARLLNGEQFIDLFPTKIRNQILDKRITRLVKSEDGNASFQTITNQSEVIKLAGRHAPFDLTTEYGIPKERVETYDTTSKLAIAAGFDALRDAGIPLVMHYKTTTVGTQLPERWGLPEEMRDDTGVIFASAFPGTDRLIDELTRFYKDQGRRRELDDLESLRARMDGGAAAAETDRRISELRHQIEAEPYVFDRRFLFRVIAFAHAQFAELIGARGPNTQVNAACASTTQAIGLAEDWIRNGRCRRVVVISADDVTNDTNLPWVASGFLATGAAATDDVVENAALPFDNRRHGMLLGMGAAAFVVEAPTAPRERGIQPIAEVLSTVIANSAFHGTRLDVDHIRYVMDRLLRQAEARGEDRGRMAKRLVFVSHETYTPARGGSAAAEINALRYCFGEHADDVVIANTKGYTGHAMGAGIEDVLAVKALETGVIPPIPNFREVDPALGQLNLSRGGAYDVDYALRLGAGFGSQISMTLLRWTPMPDGQRRAPHQLGYQYRIYDRAAWEQWLSRVSGQDRPDLEVEARKLRIADRGAPARKPAAAPPEVAPALAPVGPMDAVTAPEARAPAAPAPAPAAATPAPAAPVASPPSAPVTSPPAPPAAGVRADVRSGELPSETIGTVHKGGDPVAARVKVMVSELTGYPEDLLDLDLDLEADLGIDTVKQAEVFAALRDEFVIERDDNMRLRDFPTLNHVIGFVHDRATRLPAGTISEDVASKVPAQTAGPQPGAPVPDGDPITSTVLDVVSGLTGYPQDLLDVDLDLEADLGIDTVKQAEVFAALRAEFGISRDDDLRLRDFPTLNHVIGFMREHATTVPQAPAAAPAAAAPATPATPVASAAAPATTVPAPSAPAVDPVTTKTLSVVAELTGYPEDLLDLELDLEADLGIDTVKQAEVFAALREAFDVPRDDNLRLRDFPTLEAVIGYMQEHATNLPAAAPAAPAAAPPVAAPAPAPTAPTPAPAPAADPVTATVLDKVSELTGYPQDLLDVELDLEADLGIDTVKQAEVFAALREAFAIPRDDDLQLRDFPTLSHVIGFMREHATNLPAAPAPTAHTAPPAAAPAAAAAPAPAPEAPAGSDDPVISKVLATVAELTGYPEDLLDLELDLEADLGIDTVKQAEVFAALREAFAIPRDDDLQLRDFPTLNHVIGFMREHATNLPAAAPVADASTAAPAAPAPGAGAPAGDGDVITATALATVAELTGYPEDLLDLELDLEADLGIDTVKQAEVFAALREEFGVGRDDDLQLRDFPTLTHVIGYMREHAKVLPGGAVPVTEDAGGAAATADLHVAPAMTGDLEATDLVPRRVPVPVVRPALDECVPTAVNLGEGTRVVLMPDAGGVGDALAGRLSKRGVEVLTLDRDADRDGVTSQLDEWLGDGTIHGVYWLPALDDEGPVTELGAEGWRNAIELRVKLLYTTMRHLYDHINAPDRFLVSAARLGGYHGYDEAGATAPLGGSVTGFTKAYKREQEAVLVKAVDFPPSRKTASLADVLIEETLTDPGCVEVGRPEDGHRWTVGLRDVAFGDGDGAMELGEDSVFVVTGAAGSIVSAITADLAGAYGGTYHLLDLTPTPDPSDPDLQQFATDRDGLKGVLADRLREQGERPTPVMIEKQLAQYERLQAALTAIQAVEAVGGTVHYHSVNLTDTEAVAQVMEDVREKSGRIDVLLHAAGLEISKSLPSKEPREYDLVFDVKADGWYNLLAGAGDLPIGATVVFSSIAGRFGNSGQPDYSAANDLLCKFTSHFRRSRPDTRGLALDWTAWGGIGMATRGSIPKIMEMAGIDMLPPEAGIAWIRRELSASDFRGEVVVADALGILTQEFHHTGGLDPDRVEVIDAGPMVGEVTSAGIHTGFVIETTLDPNEHGFLEDHRIDGIPVLPGVMGMEAFAEMAQLLVPDRYVAAVEDVDFLAPFKFYRDEPRTVYLSARLRAVGDDIVADCRLEGERMLPGHDEPQRTVHFTGSVRLVTEEPFADEAEVPAGPDGAVATPDDIYHVYFHGPAYQVLAGVYGNGEGCVGQYASDLPSNHTPSDAPTVTDPRLAELCFQTSGVFEIGTSGRMALPLHVESLEPLTRLADASGEVVCVAHPREDGSGFDCEVVDADGNVLARMQGYRTVAMPAGVDEQDRAPMAAAIGN